MYNYDPTRVQYETAYRQAERRVKAKVGFYWHLASYLVVNGLLIGIYLLTALAASGLYYPWFIWPLAGWGIGLVFNFLAVFIFGDGTYNTNRMIDEEMRKMGVTNYPTYQTPTDQK
ncbi:MAG: 2TM domain-containing protein [Chloroflexi bacterium]|uniref:2TM domain-containing protein n=1 Tax=Candidatus Chlorohelix allophototropha TaxID=3003348 RepID=A0A8T7M5Z1_9CHLR|nr:2TM domain-containing protein [Chloroflexota bacterium]WJW69448.1 2TM domain-containing protein [Chloroflexota bacterium L227-S17]